MAETGGRMPDRCVTATQSQCKTLQSCWCCVSDAVLYSCATVMTMVLKTRMMLAVMHPRVVRWHLFTKWIREWQIAACSWTHSVPHQRDCQNVVMLNRLSTTGRGAGTVYAMALCLSVTSRCSTKMVRRSITLTVPHDSPRTLVVF